MLLTLITLLNSFNQLATTVIESMPPELRAQAWKDHMERTKWINDLLIKFSNKLDALIMKETDSTKTPPQ